MIFYFGENIKNYFSSPLRKISGSTMANDYDL